jgi:Kef-type K+ transport system membrane component KefB
MINILILVFIIALGIVIRIFFPVGSFEAAAAYALGILMLCGFISGNLVKKIKFPAVTGYILVGLLVGPFGLKLITADNVRDLQLLNGLALSIIALTAGGEIKLSGLKQNLKTINYILVFQTLFIVVGITVLIILLKTFIPFFSDPATFPGLSFIIAAGLLVGIISTASSPSTTLAVIVECKKKNLMTQLILSIVMLKDIVILFLFVIGLSISRTLVGGSDFNTGNLLRIFLEISGSLVVGIVIGFIIILYLKFVKKDSIIFILALCFFGYEIFEPLHLHPLLIMMIAGFVVENFSSEGQSLIDNLEAISPPVYIIFFTLTGAAINITYLKTLWLLTILIVGFRLLFKYLGTYTGAKAAKEENFVKKHMWMAFVSQAGLSLGMAKIIENNFSMFGGKIYTLIVSVIVVNQIIGPLLLKCFLDMPGCNEEEPRRHLQCGKEREETRR